MKPDDDAVVLPAGPASPLPLWKRVLDITCIALALPLLVPLMLAIAALIRFVSGRPVLFKQMRVGYNGSQFLCYKFRTMHAGAPQDQHLNYYKQLIRDQKPMTKMDDLGDTRFILGAPFLRATGFDELPQLYNVLRGEMSLVGPSPCTPDEYENYLPWHKNRFRSIPGLTGLWQVSGKNDTSFDQMVALDITYADRRSFWFDLKILLKTTLVIVAQVRAVIRRKAARIFGQKPAAISSCEERKA